MYAITYIQIYYVKPLHNRITHRPGGIRQNKTGGM